MEPVRFSLNPAYKAISVNSRPQPAPKETKVQSTALANIQTATPTFFTLRNITLGVAGITAAYFLARMGLSAPPVPNSDCRCPTPPVNPPNPPKPPIEASSLLPVTLEETNLVREACNQLQGQNLKFPELDPSVFKTQEGVLFMGSFLQDGLGCAVYSDEVHKGNFVNKELHGDGLKKDEDGDVYEGLFKNGLLYGKGVHHWIDGEKDEGEFENDLLNGDGISYRDDGTIKYQGGFQNNLFEGDGAYFREDGTLLYIYKGELENGMFHGDGTVYREDGTVEYEGEFQNDLFHGDGTYFREDGTVEYVGEFQNGLYHGTGILYGIDGTIVYQGEFRNGMPWTPQV